MTNRPSKGTLNPRKATARVVSVRRTATGAEEFVIQSDTGLEKVVTSPSSVAVMDRAVEAYSRTLKNLAKR